jgi:hypothetical protein
VEHKVEVVLDVVGAEEVGEHETPRRRGLFIRVRLSVTLAARASAVRLLWSAKGQHSAALTISRRLGGDGTRTARSGTSHAGHGTCCS